MSLFTLSIGEVVPETPRTRSVRVSLPSSGLTFIAGQAVKVGAPGQPLRKPYSIACSPEQALQQGAFDLLIQVGADGSAGTHLGAPEAGMLVDVEGPFGDFRFPPHPVERRFLFVAGGTGIAPLRAMLWHALAAFPDCQPALFYSARSPEEFAYSGEFRELARTGRISLRETVTRDSGSLWSGSRGRITHEEIAEVVAGPPVLCFVCGPPALVQDVTTWLKNLDVPTERVMAEGWT